MSPDVAAVCERLALSRSRLRQALQRQPASAGAGLGLGHLAAAATSELAHAQLRQIAQAHPYRLVFGAFVLGAGFVALRPWSAVRLAALSAVPVVTRALLPQLAASLARTWLAPRRPEEGRP